MENEFIPNLDQKSIQEIANRLDKDSPHSFVPFPAEMTKDLLLFAERFLKPKH